MVTSLLCSKDSRTY